MVQNAKFAAAKLSSASGRAPVLDAFWHDDGTGFDFRCHGATNHPFDVVERFVNEARRRPPSP
jgi:hypothetical protein